MGSRLTRRLASLVLGGAVLLACGTDYSFHGGGVRVSARLLRKEGITMVETRFRPDKRGFHIYSAALPDGGIDGLGIPTRVRAGAGLASLGPPVASRTEIQLRISALGVELPVYPDGEVVLTQVASTTPSDLRRTVIVSYGACSDAICLPPVQGQPVDVTR